MTPGDAAEALITELCISDARDLDVVAIAYDAGVHVRYQELQGCEATLAGFEDRAIATIKPSSVLGRERFSIGHELGHWKLHRGRSFRCRVDDAGDNLASDKVLEKEADTYAAHLLMPSMLFNPAVKALGQPGFRALTEVGIGFSTSLLATSIRLAHVDAFAVLLACYKGQRLRWHLAAKHVPRRWWLRDELDDDSFTYDLVTTGARRDRPGKQPAEVWFTNDDVDQYELLEDCVQYRKDEVLTLLYLTDSEMMEAGYDPNVGERRYNEYGSYVRRSSRK